MGLLQKLKSALGLNGTESSGSGPSGDVDVTVEREPSTESEDAVKGTETAGGEAAAPDEPPEASARTDEPAETAASAEDEPAGDEPTGEAEPEDVEAPPEPEAAETDVEAAPPTEPEPDDEPAAADPDAEAAAAEELEERTAPVTELNGIGPAYADRLAGVGIETVGELAVADAAEVADDIDLGESRVADWVEQAKSY